MFFELNIYNTPGICLMEKKTLFVYTSKMDDVRNNDLVTRGTLLSIVSNTWFDT